MLGIIAWIVFGEIGYWTGFEEWMLAERGKSKEPSASQKIYLSQENWAKESFNQAYKITAKNHQIQYHIWRGGDTIRQSLYGYQQPTIIASKPLLEEFRGRIWKVTGCRYCYGKKFGFKEVFHPQILVTSLDKIPPGLHLKFPVFSNVEICYHF